MVSGLMWRRRAAVVLVTIVTMTSVACQSSDSVRVAVKTAIEETKPEIRQIGESLSDTAIIESGIINARMSNGPMY